MTRVSSFGHQQVMLNSLLDNQSRVFKDQTQITTGKKVETYSGLTSETTTLLGAKTVLDQTGGFLRASDNVKRGLSTNDIQLESVVKNAQNVRDTMLQAIAQEQTFALRDLLNESYTSIVNALNTSIGGVHIFGGARTDVEPVVGKNLTDLAAAPAVSNLFQNDQRHPSAKVGQNTVMEYGLLADQIGKDVFQVFKNIEAYDASASGPLSGKLNATQISYLKGELANMDKAIEKLRVLVARNGTRQSNLDGIIKQHNGQEAYLKVFISDIEDVDVAGAITRMNNDQVALQASYKITSQLGSLSLLKYL